MAEDTKDTIYIDVDDEITTVIDKVSESKKKLVALVLPKRAAVFQSIVNMKLLKRKSDEAKKNLVIVTTEASLLPLAGAVGIHVAKTLSSKPEIPAAPVIEHEMVEAAEEEGIPEISTEPNEAEEMKKEAQKEITKSADKAKSKIPTNDLETIELDNSEEAPTDTAMPAVAKAEAKKKAKKDKSLKIPNFNKFRLWALLGGGGLILIVILWILLFNVWPHATIDIKTNAQNVNANLSFNLSTNASGVNTNTNTVRAKQVSESKTYTATVNATGQQNNGQKASGTVSMQAIECNTISAPSDVPAGTGITVNNNTYITQADTSFPSLPNGRHGSNCLVYDANNSTSITAQNGGSSYNTSDNNTTFNVPGRSDVTATGGASGGTDNITTVVSQADINNAENKITQDTAGAKSDLTNQLNQANYYPLNSTFNAGTPNISPNATAGTVANSVTVTETVGYSMYGVIKTDLVTLLNNNIKSQVNGNQSILNNGLSNASYTAGSNPTNLTLVTTAIVGPNINTTVLKNQITGQKVGQIESIVKSNPDVSSVTIKLSPFYVSKAPSPSKITINIAKPTNNPNATTN